MRSEAKRRCFVVGMGAMAQACTEILLSNDWEVIATHSPDQSLAAVFDHAAVPHYAIRAEFISTLTNEPFDYLFSLNNPWIIPQSVIDLAGEATINYHDSPLPKYAGLNATSWAIMNGERFHAVSFHEITENIDDGAIYKQQVLPIDENDTTFTLNTKCFEAAVKTFGELVAELTSGTAKKKPQLIADRSYFGHYDQPPSGSILDFSKPAYELHNLIRALDFGSTPNPLGSAKLFLGSTFVVVQHSRVLAPTYDRSVSAGQFLRSTNDAIDVATSDGTIRLERFSTLEGQTLGVAEVLAIAGVKFGSLFPALDPKELEVILRSRRAAARFEHSWVDDVRQVRAAPMPFSNTQKSAALPKPPVKLERFAHALDHHDSQCEQDQPCKKQTAATAAICVLFHRLTELRSDEALNVGFTAQGYGNRTADLLFARWVPFAVDIAADQTFSSFFELVATAMTSTKRRQTYCRDVFVCHPQLRGVDRPHYGVGISVNSLEEDEVLATATANAHTTEVDLVFNLAETPHLQHGGRLEPWQVASIDKALAAIVSHAAKHQGALLRELPLVCDVDYEMIVDTWNATAAPFANGCVHDLITESVIKFPHAPALRCPLYSYTYLELGGATDALAAQLQADGVVRGDVVAVCLERTSLMVVALIAILKAGASYVPIDPKYPDERLESIVSEAMPRVLLTTNEHRSRFTKSVRNIDFTELQTGQPTPVQAVVPSTFSVPASSPEDLAYVIYTSGSTGRPKGVEIRHRSLVNHSTAIAANYKLGPTSRLLCSASIGFDVAGEQIYPALFAGAEIVIAPDTLFDSFTGFNTFIADHAITAMVLPTAYWHEWVRDLSASGGSPPASLKSLSVGTEKALGSSLKSWMSVSGGNVRFFQGYGPTETTITSTMLVHDGKDVDANQPLSIGRPLPNTQVYLLDRSLHPIPVGAIGEMYIGGVGLARGYRGQAQLTSEKFVKHPFTEGERLFRTGDLAWMGPSGEIFFVGRHDFQVKVRGFRVELGEIEQLLRSHTSIDEAVVVQRSDSGVQELIGYVIAAPGVTGGQLLEFVREHLPDYMVPNQILTLSAFPKTPNGKVDRAALPPPPRSETIDPKGGQSPDHPSQLADEQRQLIALWEELIPGRTFGISDDFFYFGGNSLIALRMLSEVDRRFSAAIPLSQFVARPTISMLLDSLPQEHLVVAPTNSLVVKIQAPSNGRPPLWLIHPVGGHVVFAHRLREHMRASQGIYAIQSRGLDGCEEPLLTIEEMAKHYVELIKEVQPEGPYCLAGPSMGGLISFEIARLLELNANRVALVALLDTWGPGYPSVTSRWVCTGDQITALRDAKGLLKKIRKVRSFMSGEDGPANYDGIGEADISSQFGEAITRVTDANTIAMNTYVPKPFGGNLVLLRAVVTPNWPCMRFDDQRNGWGPFVISGIKVIPILTEHIELADRPPPEAAQVLQWEIDAAFAR